MTKKQIKKITCTLKTVLVIVIVVPVWSARRHVPRSLSRFIRLSLYIFLVNSQLRWLIVDANQSATYCYYEKCVYKPEINCALSDLYPLVSFGLFHFLLLLFECSTLLFMFDCLTFTLFINWFFVCAYYEVLVVVLRLIAVGCVCVRVFRLIR